MDTKHIVDPIRGGRRKGAGRPKGTGKYGWPSVPVRLPICLVDEYQDWLDAQMKNRMSYQESITAAGAIKQYLQDKIDKKIKKDGNNG